MIGGKWRHRVLGLVLVAALIGTLATIGGLPFTQAQSKTLCVGITFPLTGADASDATLHTDAVRMAFDEANAKGGVAGYKIKYIILDNGTATAGQYDPAQAATNARTLVANSCVVGNVGPEMSGDGKAMSPIFSEADMATITPASTNPDITSPKFAAQFRPAGKAVYFRTVTTDAFQGPEMANFYAETLHAKRVYILDDSGAYGVGLANAFEARAKAKGMTVLGHDQLNPREADYTTILTKIKGMSPEAIYYGGVAQAGVTLAKQAYDAVPKMLKGGGDGVSGASFLRAGFPAVQNWYSTSASPHLTQSPVAASFIKAFEKRWNLQPDDYSITSYDAALVVIDAIQRVAASGKPVNRHTVRDAIQSTHLKTMQGVVTFDANGDITDRTVTVFQWRRNKEYPASDALHQLVYIGVAPQH